MREQNNTGHFTNRDTTYIMAHIYHSATLTCCLALDVDGTKSAARRQFTTSSNKAAVAGLHC